MKRVEEETVRDTERGETERNIGRKARAAAQEEDKMERENKRLLKREGGGGGGNAGE